MSAILTKLERICSEIERQTQDIKYKAWDIDRVWKSVAQRSFKEAHDEMERYAIRTKNEINSMKNIARSLESSIQAADRDKLAKKNRRY